jgi:hypothetical protein
VLHPPVREEKHVPVAQAGTSLARAGIQGTAQREEHSSFRISRQVLPSTRAGQVTILGVALTDVSPKSILPSNALTVASSEEYVVLVEEGGRESESGSAS